MTFILPWANRRSTPKGAKLMVLTAACSCTPGLLHHLVTPAPCNKAMETCHPHLNPQVTQLARGWRLWWQEHAATPQLTLHQAQQDMLGLYLSSCCAAHFSFHIIPTGCCKLLGRRKSKVERLPTLILFPDIGRIHNYRDLDQQQLWPFNF